MKKATSPPSRRAGCDLAWLPPLEAMYPPDAVTTIEIAGPAERWEGAARPGHFRGVATVVAKLFGQVRPAAACFGEKDWQQVQVVRRLSRDLHLGVAIVPVPTVRDPDGIALSSRNRSSRKPRGRAPRFSTARSRNSGRRWRTAGPPSRVSARLPACLKRRVLHRNISPSWTPRPSSPPGRPSAGTAHRRRPPRRRPPARQCPRTMT